MKAHIADPKTKNQKQNLSILLSESSSDCTPDGWRLFAVSHRIYMEARIANPEMKNERRIIAVFLSVSAGDCTTNDR